MTKKNATCVLQWLEKKSFSIDSVQAGMGYDDLYSMANIFGKSKIIGLGEATHGTREFFQFKHRLVEFLVEELGFRVFGLEAGIIPCLRINDYVLYGKDDPNSALANQGYFCWDTEEVSELIEWMRYYNLHAPRTKMCEFLGYDIKPVREGMEFVEDYISKVLPEHLPLLQEGFAGVYELDLYGRDLNLDALSESLQKLFALQGVLEIRREKCIATSSQKEFEAAVQSLVVVTQLVDTFDISEQNGGVSLSTIKRDLYMAENIERIVSSYPADTRFIMWAHNGHIEINRNWVNPGSLNMGALLRERFGDDYYALGLTFSKGSFQARRMREDAQLPGPLGPFTVDAAPEGFVEWYLANAKGGNYLVDFRMAPEHGPVADWLTTSHRMRSIGAGFSNDWSPRRYSQNVILREHYDGLAYIEKTSPAKTNPTGERVDGQAGALI